MSVTLFGSLVHRCDCGRHVFDATVQNLMDMYMASPKPSSVIGVAPTKLHTHSDGWTMVRDPEHFVATESALVEA